MDQNICLFMLNGININFKMVVNLGVLLAEQQKQIQKMIAKKEHDSIEEVNSSEEED